MEAGVLKEFEQTLSPVIPHATTNEMHVPSPKHSQPMYVYDDLWADLCNDNDNFQLGDDTFKTLFQPDEYIPVDNVSLEVFKEMKGQEHTVTEGIPSVQVNLNLSEEVDISIPPARVVVPEASTSTAAKGSLKRQAQELGDNMCVPNSKLPFSKNNPNACNHPSGMKTTVILGTIGPQLGASLGNNSVFPNAKGNSLNQFQSTFQVHPYGSASSIDGSSASAVAGFGTSAAVSAGANASAGGIASMNSTPVTLGTIDPQLGGSFGNSMCPNATKISVNQSQSSNLQGHPHGSASSVAGSSASATASVGANASANGIVGMNNTTVILEIIDPQLGTSFGDSMLPNTIGNPINKFKLPNFPVHGNGSASAVGEANTSAGTSCGANAGVSALASVTGSVGADVSAGGVACSSARASIDANVVSSANINADNTTARLGTIDPQGPPPRVGTSYCNTTGKSLLQFQSCSSSSLGFPVQPYNGSASSSAGANVDGIARYLPYQMTGINPQGVPATMSQHNKRLLWPRPPSLKEFPNFVDAWEGILVGKIHSYRGSHIRAKAVRKPTSPSKLTARWGSWLEIVLFVPTKAVNYIMKVCGGPIDYVFFQITQFNNLDLYDHMTSKNLCAKIELPSQTVILSTTKDKHYYLGSVFHGDMVFVEPVEPEQPRAIYE